MSSCPTGWHSCWLSSAFARRVTANSSDIVTIQQPRAYGARVRSALDASPASVELRSLLPSWYALAVRLARLCVFCMFLMLTQIGL